MQCINMDWLDKFRPQVIDLKLYFYADSESLNSGHWKCYKPYLTQLNTYI